MKKIKLNNKATKSLLERDVIYRRKQIGKLLTNLRRLHYMLDNNIMRTEDIEKANSKIYELERELNALLCMIN